MLHNMSHANPGRTLLKKFLNFMTPTSENKQTENNEYKIVHTNATQNEASLDETSIFSPRPSASRSFDHNAIKCSDRDHETRLSFLIQATINQSQRDNETDQNKN